MPSLLTCRNVSFYKKELFGLSQINVEIWRGKKYHFLLKTDDKLNSFLGLLENRYQPDSGSVEFTKGLVTQSDRLLLDDRVYSYRVDSWLRLRDEMFLFGGKRQTKSRFIEELKAKHITAFPIYKLTGEDKIKFTLLSLTFQESGIIILHRLLFTRLSDNHLSYLIRLIRDTQTALCLVTTVEHPPPRAYGKIIDEGFIRIDLRSN